MMEIRREDLADSLIASLRACGGWKNYLTPEERRQMGDALLALAAEFFEADDQDDNHRSMRTAVNGQQRVNGYKMS